jgi:hypothetical protein
MRHLAFLFSVVAVGLMGTAVASAQPDPEPRFNPQAVWEPSASPQSSDAHRTGSGHPGPNHWQNHVDYAIEARLDTASHLIKGAVQYTYTNNSPTPLHSVWLITGTASTTPATKSTDAPTNSRIRIDDVTVKGTEHNPASTYRTNRRTQIRLKNPVSANGGTVTFSLEYRVSVSLEGTLPTRAYIPSGVLYEIGHWYPRVAAYSEQRGWAESPARRPGEALSEYGSYDYSVTVPATLIIAASGTLMNSDAVLTADQRRRLMRARDSNGKVAIITPDQAGSPDTRPKQTGQLTWEYQMNGVRNVAWAASPSFIWNAARIPRDERRDGLAMSFYPRSSMGGQSWNRSTYHTQKAMKFFSKRLKTSPWNTAINVAGPVGHKSFPGISFCSRSADGYRLFSCTVQNFSQNWFSVILGPNEERHPWLTEGLSTAVSVLAHRSLHDGEFSPKQDSTFAPQGNAPAEGLRPLMTAPQTASITTAPSLQPKNWKNTLASYKPAYGLLLLREYILDPDQFDYALRQYVQRWAYRQPTPQDFFNAMNDATGEDLSWFWTSWFRHAWAIDQAVTNVSYENGTPNDGASITLKLRRKMPMPVKAKITEADGDTRLLSLPVEVWQRGNTYTMRLDTDSRIQTVELDPNNQLPDVASENDEWPPDETMGTADRSP